MKCAIEFMRRGLWVDDCITVHGPHEPPSDFMWGKAGAIIDGDTSRVVDCTFTTTRQIRNKYDLRWVRIRKDDFEKMRFPILEDSELTPKRANGLGSLSAHSKS